jgi:hypothetical protein
MRLTGFERDDTKWRRVLLIFLGVLSLVVVLLEGWNDAGDGKQGNISESIISKIRGFELVQVPGIDRSVASFFQATHSISVKRASMRAIV